jgi:hypothetical protein
MTICKDAINSSMIIRIILTIISIFLLSKYKISFINNNLYLILPILLTILDETDNINTFNLKYKGKLNGCTKTFDYQIKDKYVDVFSYLYTNYILGLDATIYKLSIYRLIGVILFGLSGISTYLIIFFDFVKEYMLYKYVFGDINTYLPVVIILKIIFEYYFHSHVNKKQY